MTNEDLNVSPPSHYLWSVLLDLVSACLWLDDVTVPLRQTWVLHYLAEHPYELSPPGAL